MSSLYSADGHDQTILQTACLSIPVAGNTTVLRSALCASSLIRCQRSFRCTPILRRLRISGHREITLAIIFIPHGSLKPLQERVAQVGCFSHFFCFPKSFLPILFRLVGVKKSHLPSPWPSPVAWHCGTTRCHAASTVLAPYNTRAAEWAWHTAPGHETVQRAGRRAAKLNPTKCRRSSPPPPYRRCRWPRGPGTASGLRLPTPPPPRTGPAPLPDAPAPAGSRPSFPGRWSASATALPSAWPSESSACPSRRADFSRFTVLSYAQMRNG